MVVPVFHLKSVQEQIAELTSVLPGPIDELSFAAKSFLFAELAIMAYYDETLARAQAKKMGFETARKVRNSHGDDIATVIIGTNDIIISLKGTEDMADLKTDLNLDLVKDGDLPGKVHDGFRIGANTIWDSIAPIIENSENVWLTGHSMGGAIASILAVRAARGAGPSVRAIFTFGAPRVGNRTYVAGLEADHSRWVHHHDLIPRIPTKWMGYSHFGQEHYISGGIVPKRTLWNRIKRFFSRLLDGLSLDGISDHNIVQYRSAIDWFRQESDNGN